MQDKVLLMHFVLSTRNLYVGAATLTQPIFMGGKIVAYNKITKYAEQLAQSNMLQACRM